MSWLCEDCQLCCQASHPLVQQTQCWWVLHDVQQSTTSNLSIQTWSVHSTVFDHRGCVVGICLWVIVHICVALMTVIVICVTTCETSTARTWTTDLLMMFMEQVCAIQLLHVDVIMCTVALQITHITMTHLFRVCCMVAQLIVFHPNSVMLASTCWLFDDTNTWFVMLLMVLAHKCCIVLWYVCCCVRPQSCITAQRWHCLECRCEHVHNCVEKTRNVNVDWVLCAHVCVVVNWRQWLDCCGFRHKLCQRSSNDCIVKQVQVQCWVPQ